MVQEFSKDELRHWLLHPDGSHNKEDQIVWSYVVETEGKVTDFFSFYLLESSVIRENAGSHREVRAAYSYYYATDAAFQDNEEKFKKRLNELIKDELIIARQVHALFHFALRSLTVTQNKFDVFNALSLLDNRHYLDQQKFGVGDGLLYYYLYNYRAAPISGGLDDQKRMDPKVQPGVGLIML
jgi:glycylpeptide N-tetradecanoyltransferase